MGKTDKSTKKKILRLSMLFLGTSLMMQQAKALVLIIIVIAGAVAGIGSAAFFWQRLGGIEHTINMVGIDISQVESNNKIDAMTQRFVLNYNAGAGGSERNIFVKNIEPIEPLGSDVLFWIRADAGHSYRYDTPARFTVDGLLIDKYWGKGSKSLDVRESGGQRSIIFPNLLTVNLGSTDPELNGVGLSGFEAIIDERVLKILIANRAAKYNVKETMEKAMGKTAEDPVKNLGRIALITVIPYGKDGQIKYTLIKADGSAAEAKTISSDKITPATEGKGIANEIIIPGTYDFEYILSGFPSQKKKVTLTYENLQTITLTAGGVTPPADGDQPPTPPTPPPGAKTGDAYYRLTESAIAALKAKGISTAYSDIVSAMKVNDGAIKISVVQVNGRDLIKFENVSSRVKYTVSFNFPGFKPLVQTWEFEDGDIS